MIPIDNIVECDEKSLDYNLYKDINILMDECQFLKRSYNYIGENNKAQISNRIFLLAQFYDSRPTIGSHYPTMIITKTYPIFIKHYNRIKTFNPNHTSSLVYHTSKSKNNQSKKQQPTQNYLNNNYLNNNYFNIQLSQLQSCLSQNTHSIDQSFGSHHDIYQNHLSEKTLQCLKFIVSDDLAQMTVQHLICNYDDFNVQDTLTNYKKYEIRNKNQSKGKKTQLITKITIQPIDSFNNGKTGSKYLNSNSNNYDINNNSVKKSFIKIAQQNVLHCRLQKNQKIIREQLEKVYKNKINREKANQLLGFSQTNNQYKDNIFLRNQYF